MDENAARNLREKKRRDGSLIVVLSSLESGVQRRLKSNLASVFHREEHPEEGEVHPSIVDLNFTSQSGGLTSTFYESWQRLIGYRMVEPVGSNGDDYLPDCHTLSEMASMSLEEGIIPREHYGYLMGFREKIQSVAW